MGAAVPYPHLRGDYRPREAPALAATADELVPEEAPTEPVLALEDGATETADDEGATPCHEEFPALLA
jgi:hypothetical protein